MSRYPPSGNCVSVTTIADFLQMTDIPTETTTASDADEPREPEQQAVSCQKQQSAAVESICIHEARILSPADFVAFQDSANSILAVENRACSSIFHTIPYRLFKMEYMRHFATTNSALSSPCTLFPSPGYVIRYQPDHMMQLSRIMVGGRCDFPPPPASDDEEPTDAPQHSKRKTPRSREKEREGSTTTQATANCSAFSHPHAQQ